MLHYECAHVTVTAVLIILPLILQTVTRISAHVLTSSKDLGQHTLVMHGIDLVRSFPELVLRVEQPSILRVAQQKVGDAFAAASDRHMQRVITTLTETDLSAMFRLKIAIHNILILIYLISCPNF